MHPRRLHQCHRLLSARPNAFCVAAAVVEPAYMRAAQLIAQFPNVTIVYCVYFTIRYT